MSKKFYLETYGCQMNAHDSEKVSAEMSSLGFEPTDDVLEAGVILLNTCMVREKPEQKVFHRITEIKQSLSANSTSKSLPIIGVMGCVAQAEAERIFERNSNVSLVVGTQSIGKIGGLLSQLEQGFPRAIDIQLSREADFYEISGAGRRNPNVAYISIIEGCNKFCSFCIVPYTRGRERSRPASQILQEAKTLAENGCQEVFLLGQNVNSYGLSARFRGNTTSRYPTDKHSDELTFAQLLRLLAEESGIPRIKYTTSHPRDFDAEIVRVMDECPTLCEWIHLPVQSGSDRILRVMRRGYTTADYLRKIQDIKLGRKDYSITTDIIVGFPGETESDFSDTLRLIAEVEYDGIYAFNYSPRPNTPATALPDSVPDEVKKDRFQRMMELQQRIQSRRYARYLGEEVEVLVEGRSQRSDNDFTGHTRSNKVVNFPGKGGLLPTGKSVKVLIEEVKRNSLYGQLVDAIG